MREHPLRERLHGQLMLCLYRAGRQAEALEAFRRARAVLVEELGIEPGRSLRQLHEAILAQDPRLDLPVEAPVDGTPRGAFVGRERELAELVRGLDDAFAGRGSLFLLAGEPGVGKSRLAEELIARTRARGARVLVGRCWEAGGAPAYWPWVQSLRPYLRDADAEVLRSQLREGAVDVARLHPELRERLGDLAPAPAIESEGARFRLFDSLTAFIKRMAAAQPLVVVLDDLHAADEPSLLLLRFVARELGDSRLLIVGAYRDVDPTLADPLKTTVTELAREPVTRRLALAGLAANDVVRFIELAAPGAPAAELGLSLHAETEGNPLFVGEIVRLLATEQRLSEAGTGPLAIPQSVREVIGSRLRHLSSDCDRLLTVASVMGREFDIDPLAAVIGLDRDAVLELLDEAIEARVVSGVSGAVGRVRFAHALIRDAAYHSLTSGRRARLHRQVGEALEALYASDLEAHLAELAHHFYESAAVDGRDKAVGYSRRAGARAVGLLAFEEAARLYQMALAALGADGAAQVRCELLLALGDAQSRSGDAQAAKATFLRAAELGRTAGLPELVARAAAGYGGRFLWTHAIADERIVPLLEDALSGLGEEHALLRVQLLSRLAAALRHSPTRERREDICREALRIARRIGDPPTLANALAATAAAMLAPDTAPARLAEGEEIVSAAARAGDQERLFDGHEHSFWAAWELGDPDRRAAELAEMVRVANELRQPAQLWTVAAAKTTLALSHGRFAEAAEQIEQAAATGGRAMAWSALRRAGSSCSCCAASRQPSPASSARSRTTRTSFPHRSCTAPSSLTSTPSFSAPRTPRPSCASSPPATWPTGTSTRNGWSASVCSLRPVHCSMTPRPPDRSTSFSCRRLAERRRPSRTRARLRQPAARHPREPPGPVRRSGGTLSAGAADERSDGSSPVRGAHARGPRPHAAAARRSRRPDACGRAPGTSARDLPRTRHATGREEHGGTRR